ncbi:hypothetical protein FHS78_003675 [Parvibaculum indicum]|uniref:exopolysaccharide biosynthesis protein n=1 Tax=Parvibaculum indicum TaxID=562969 RepID=UPI0014225257|nr:exopolysaccharide biosynthesis protein [Parvibaculum indicum]NIJ43361.1 hypothetical protein [Parvibaculum indicum]
MSARTRYDRAIEAAARPRKNRARTPDKDGPASLEDIIELLIERARNEESITVGDLMDAVASRSFGPVLVVPALIAVLPLIGAIPGMTILTGMLVVMIAGQRAIGLEHFWLPERLEAIRLDADTVKKGGEKMRGTARVIDRLFRTRVVFLTGRTGTWVTALVCVGLGLIMLPSALLPFAVIAPASAVLFLALGMTATDGLMVLIGFVLSAGSAVGAVWYIVPHL